MFGFFKQCSAPPPGIRVHPRYAMRLLTNRHGELDETTIYAHDPVTLEEIRTLLQFSVESVLMEEWNGEKWV